MTQDAFDLEADRLLDKRSGMVDRWASATLRRQLAALSEGSVTLDDGERRERFGDPGARLRATVYVDDARFYRSVAFGGALGGAEAYMDGYWRCDDLSALLRILAATGGAGRLEGASSSWRRPLLSLFHALRNNSRAGSRRNIAAHYDLGNEFFELFLDPTLSYSSGVFEHAGASMREASVAKLERVCRKLRLRPTDHVLEIGTGWGGFALHAAERFGCRVTTTTISRRQYELARARVDEAGLADRVEVLFEDYRDLRGRYDRLVSIEMIEAVGHEHLGEFFRVCGERLAPDGAMALQAITVPDQHYAEHTRSVDFIKRYIFPGGELVSVGALANAARETSDLRLVHLEDLTPHYAETLRRWRARMFENLPAMRALGLDERFLRMWEFYLCYCEAGFEERETGLVQVVLEGPAARTTSLGV